MDILWSSAAAASVFVRTFTAREEFHRISFFVSPRPSHFLSYLFHITSCGGQYPYLTFARMPCLHHVKVWMSFCS